MGLLGSFLGFLSNIIFLLAVYLRGGRYVWI